MPAVKLAVLLAVGCTEPIPRAVVHAGTSSSLGHAVLVLPTACATELGDRYCAPSTYGNPAMHEVAPAAYAELVDPALRLKLEFAGYTLAEAATMQVTSGDRVERRVSSDDGDGRPTSGAATEVTAGLAVSALSPAEIGEVARSLQLAGIVTSTLRVSPAPYGGKTFELTVALYPLDRPTAEWSVTCSERFLDNATTARKLGNCVGNGVLAAFSPDNLIGKPR